ncbi:PHP domain-containing protein [Myxococcus faecalis]|uniref:PHP domain-containing protein n=1 Tax=Myxococcus faecalis TaxID=3115646 RepID=UPI003CF6996D
MIDLHSHTTASDGQYTPTQLLERARAAGVTVLSVTDHDTVAGLAEAKAAALANGVELVPGIEISAFVLGREVHILGHFVRPEDEDLARFAQRLRGEREQRMEAMVARMQQLGFPVRMEHVRAIAGDAQLGRPHLARVLVDQGWAVDMKAAFDRFLGTRGMAWVERFKLDGADAISLIRKAGGTATLAHPGSSKVERMELRELVKAGLAGLEVLHADHNPALKQKYLALAKEHDLVPTSGSDFHGEAVSADHKLGSAAMPPELFAKLRSRATA